MVVVVLLADPDPAWREATVGEIRAAHPAQLEQGQLLVIHVPSQFYPPLTGTGVRGGAGGGGGVPQTDFVQSNTDHSIACGPCLLH